MNNISNTKWLLCQKIYVILDELKKYLEYEVNKSLLSVDVFDLTCPAMSHSCILTSSSSLYGTIFKWKSTPTVER